MDVEFRELERQVKAGDLSLLPRLRRLAASQDKALVVMFRTLTVCFCQYWWNNRNPDKPVWSRHTLSWGNWNEWIEEEAGDYPKIGADHFTLSAGYDRICERVIDREFKLCYYPAELLALPTKPHPMKREFD